MKKIKEIISRHEEIITTVNGLAILMAGILMTLMTSCTDEDESTLQKETTVRLNMTMEQWGDNPTRASYNTTEGSSIPGTISLTTVFDEGDAIGVYVVDKEGKTVVANRKYSLTDNGWTAEEPIEYENGMGSYSFFAYYPYRQTLTDAPTTGSTSYDVTSEKTFFRDAIVAWTTEADQSTKEKFTKSDLMAAKGNNSMTGIHQVTVSFTMKHMMGLLVTKDEIKYYDVDDPTDTWTVTQNFTTNIPYAAAGSYYFLARPDVETTLGTRTTTVGIGEAEQLYSENGIPGKR